MTICLWPVLFALLFGLGLGLASHGLVRGIRGWVVTRERVAAQRVKSRLQQRKQQRFSCKTWSADQMSEEEREAVAARHPKEGKS